MHIWLQLASRRFCSVSLPLRGPGTDVRHPPPGARCSPGLILETPLEGSAGLVSGRGVLWPGPAPASPTQPGLGLRGKPSDLGSSRPVPQFPPSVKWADKTTSPGPGALRSCGQRVQDERDFHAGFPDSFAFRLARARQGEGSPSSFSIRLGPGRCSSIINPCNGSKATGDGAGGAVHWEDPGLTGPLALGSLG